MLDRRRNIRRKTFLGGRVVFNHRESTYDCILKNLGESGAKLVFPQPTFLPDEFDVQVARLERSFHARVTWRSRLELGVAFVNTHRGTNVVPIDHALRLRKLEAENIRLGQRVAELSLPVL